MSTKLFTTVLLAAGLAAGKPVASYRSLQDPTIRQSAPARANVCAVRSSGMVSALAALETKGLGEVPQVRAENFVFGVNNGRGVDALRDLKGDVAAQEVVLQQVNRALLADQRENAAEKELDDVLRAIALAKEEPEKSAIALVISDVIVRMNVAVRVNGREEKRALDAKLFKQEALVANRGKRETKTVIVHDARTLTVTDAPTATGAGNLAKITGAPVAAKTRDVILFDAKPTHVAAVEDPAVLLRKELEAALIDRQKDENRENDARVNINIAVIKGEKADGRDELKDIVEDKDDKKNDDEAERLKELELEHEHEEQRKEEQDRLKAEQELKEQQKDEEERKKAEQKLRDQEQQKKDAEQLKKDAEQRERDQEKKEQEAKKLAKAKQDKKEAEELAKAKQDAEEKAKKEAEEKARKDAKEKAKKEAEDKAKKEAEDKARKDAEEKAKKDAVEKARREAEAKKEAVEKARADAEAKKQADAKAKQDAEEKARAEAEAKAKAQH